MSRERLSALLDEPGGDAAAARHLESCETCRREQERMRRMRMALSALDDLEPPADEWERIEAALPPEPADTEAGGTRGTILRGLSGTGLRAAAAVLLFLGGTWLGVTVRDGGPEPAAAGPGDRVAEVSGDERSGTDPDADGATRPTEVRFEPGGDADDARRWLAGLQSLRARGPAPEDVATDPGRAAEHLARLDALIQASSAYIRDVPSDAEVNDFLFDVVEERNSLDRALGFASLEYR